MAKGGRRSGGTAQDVSPRRDALVAAAFDALRDEGYGRASARSIAKRAECNSALVFYYFDTVDQLLVEALASSGAAHQAKYAAALEPVTQLDELVATVKELVADDIGSGHVKVLAELIGASASSPELKEAVFAQVEPWLALTERTLDRVLGAAGLAGIVPTGQLSFVVVSLFLGLELLTEVADGGDANRMNELFDSAGALVGLLAAFSPGSPT